MSTAQHHHPNNVRPDWATRQPRLDPQPFFIERGSPESPLREARAIADIPSAWHGVVYEGKISWPTRGPNVDWAIGSTMRRRADW